MSNKCCKQQSNFKIQLNNRVIEMSDTVKDLGLIIDQFLHFDAHVTQQIIVA